MITESREVHQVIPPGTEIEWRIVITNRSTQDKVLQQRQNPNPNLAAAAEA